MAVVTSFVVSILVLALAAAPFPGAVFLLPLQAAAALWLSFTRPRRLNLANWALIVATPWFAPPSLRAQGFFAPALSGLQPQRRWASTASGARRERDRQTRSAEGLWPGHQPAGRGLVFGASMPITNLSGIALRAA